MPAAARRVSRSEFTPPFDLRPTQRRGFSQGGGTQNANFAMTIGLRIERTSFLLASQGDSCCRVESATIFYPSPTHSRRQFHGIGSFHPLCALATPEQLHQFYLIRVIAPSSTGFAQCASPESAHRSLPRCECGCVFSDKPDCRVRSFLGRRT